MAGDVYPGDCNKDNLVNHMDLFPIGLMFGQYGSPRNLADTNISFGVPKKVNNWFFELRGINGKHADVDGNGWVDEQDLNHLKRNFGKDRDGDKNKILVQKVRRCGLRFCPES